MNISPTTIIFVVIVGVIIFGPDKLPELARKLARVLHYLRQIANQAETTVRTELGPDFADFDIRNPRKFVTDKLLGEYQSIAGELDDVRGTVSGVVADTRGAVAGASATVAGLRASQPIETTVIESQPGEGEAVARQHELREGEAFERSVEHSGATAATPPAEPASATGSDADGSGHTVAGDVDAPDWRDAHVARYQAQAAEADARPAAHALPPISGVWAGSDAT